MANLAKFARVIRNPKTALARRQRPIWGVTFHTTGSEPLTRAERKGTSAVAEAIDIYRTQPGPTYLIDWSGQVWAITPDELLKTHHTRITPEQAQAMRWGTWMFDVAPAALRHWEKRWGDVAGSPLDLFPGSDPKEVYIGVEMLPVRVGPYHPGPRPMAPGLKFTRAQHDAAARLARDIADRYKLPSGWQRTGRLTGHEDLNPADRDDAGGGWDPGVLRDDPYFDRAYVERNIAAGDGRAGVWLVVALFAAAGGAGVVWWRRARRRRRGLRG